MPPTLFLQFFSYSPITCSLNPTARRNNLSNAQTPPLATNRGTELTAVSGPISQSNTTIRVPTAPWMKGPLILQPRELLNLSKSRDKKGSKNANLGEKSDKALTGKESGVRGNKAMAKIVKTIDKMQKYQELVGAKEDSEKFEIGESIKRLGGGDGDVGGVGKKLPWLRDEKVLCWRIKKEKVVTKAELSLDKDFLERLREEAARMRIWVKVMKAGVTQDVVNKIRLAWRSSELAMLKFSVPLCRNMDRAREIVEV